MKIDVKFCAVGSPQSYKALALPILEKTKAVKKFRWQGARLVSGKIYLPDALGRKGYAFLYAEVRIEAGPPEKFAISRVISSFCPHGEAGSLPAYSNPSKGTLVTRISS